MAWAVRGRSSAVFGPSVWRGPRDRRAIALTFDDGPGESTPRVLELLDRHGAHATFFQCGCCVERFPGIARAVLEAGHEIGNHGYSHARLYLRTARFIFRELSTAQRAIQETVGVEPRLFRAPYGVRWFGMREAQRRLNLLGVMWTCIARDWRLPGPRIASRLLAAAQNGAIFCLHDGGDAGPALEALEIALPRLKEQGYDLVTVGELLW